MNWSIKQVFGLPFSDYPDIEHFRSAAFHFKPASVLNPDGSPNYIGGSAHRHYFKSTM